MFLTDKFGQRAFVGKICMDLNDIVPEYKETTEESIKETERYVCLDLSRGWEFQMERRNPFNPGRMCTCVTDWVCLKLYEIDLILRKMLHINTIFVYQVIFESLWVLTIL